MYDAHHIQHPLVILVPLGTHGHKPHHPLFFILGDDGLSPIPVQGGQVALADLLRLKGQVHLGMCLANEPKELTHRLGVLAHAGVQIELLDDLVIQLVRDAIVHSSHPGELAAQHGGIVAV